MHKPIPMPEPEGLDYADMADRLRADADRIVEQQAGRRRRMGLIAGIAAVAIVGGGIAVATRGSTSETGTASDTSLAAAGETQASNAADEPPATDAAPVTTIVDSPDTAAQASEASTTIAETTTTAAADTSTSAAAAPTESSAPVTTVATASAGDTGFDSAATELPVRYAVFDDGKIYLRGKVPTQTLADEIAARAGKVIGDANVYVEYTIDPAALAPNNAPVYVADTVLFSGGSTTINSEFYGLLDLGLALLSQYPEVRIVIEGHTDDRGDEQYNLDLSQRRVDAILQYIDDKGGDISRVDVIAKGESEPIADNSTNEGQQANRRIEFTIIDLIK